MSAAESFVIDGYDVLAEPRRLVPSDRVLWGRSLNRATAVIGAPATGEGAAAQTPAGQRRDLAWPTSGLFVATPGGITMDVGQGVAQRLIDDQHPLFQRTIAALAESGLAFRREQDASERLRLSTAVEGLHSPSDLLALINAATARALPAMSPCVSLLSGGGAAAAEAGVKLAQRHAYQKFVARHGQPVLARVMHDLGIPRDERLGSDDNEPLYSDYPFFLVGCDGGFHGSTLGVLSLSRAAKHDHLGFGRLRWIAHIPFNGDPAAFEQLIDDRPITEILDAPGGVKAVVEAGRMPVDLVAALVLEVFQGEAGQRLVDGAWIRAVARACERRDVLLCSDEVQTFGRTGRLFAIEHTGVSPDILWTGGASVLGVTVASDALLGPAGDEWQRGSDGAGGLFDVCLAWDTWQLLTEHREPSFGGRGYLENSRIKGEYLRMRLAELSAAHPEAFPAFTGLGGLWGLTVAERDEVVATASRLGLELQASGEDGEQASVRLLLLADVLTHEIDQLVAVLGRVFEAVEAAHPDL